MRYAAPNAQLNEQAAGEIRQLHAEGLSVRALADRFSVGHETIRRVLRWETWRGAPELAPRRSEPSSAEAAASLTRLQALMNGEATGEGLARLNKETGVLNKGAQLLNELACKPPGGVLDSGHGGHPPAGTDGTAKMT